MSPPIMVSVDETLTEPLKPSQIGGAFPGLFTHLQDAAGILANVRHDKHGILLSLYLGEVKRAGISTFHILSTPDSDGRTAANEATWRGNWKALKCMLDSLDEPEEKHQLVKSDGWLCSGTLLHDAVQSANIQTVRVILMQLSGDQLHKLMKVQANGHVTALHIALRGKKTAIAMELMEPLKPKQRLDVLKRVKDENEKGGHNDMYGAACLGEPAIAEFLTKLITSAQEEVSSEKANGTDDRSIQSRVSHSYEEGDQSSLAEYLHSHGLILLLDDIAEYCWRDQASPGSLVNFGEDHDKIFAKLWPHSKRRDTNAAVSCIIVSYKVENRATEDLIILVKGDVPVVNDYSRTGENFTWQLSRILLWNEALSEFIDFDQPMMPFIQCPPHKVFKLRSSSADKYTINPITPTVNKGVISYSNSEMTLKLAQPLSGVGTTAEFLLFSDANLVDFMTGTFEEIKAENSFSNSSSASIYIDELHRDEDVNSLTIIEISAKVESSFTGYLYYIVAGNLPNLCEKELTATQPLTVRAHYINNDMLHEKITEKFESEESLQGIPAAKREKIKQTGPPFIVTSALPMIRSDGSGEYEIRNILPAEDIELIDGNEQYIYRQGATLVFRLNEPQSPLSFTVGSFTYSVNPQEPSKRWTDDLDEVQLELFNTLRKSHNQQGTVHSKDAVTAITVVAVHGNDKPQISTHVYFVPALVFGKDLTDLKTCAPSGWRVTSLHLYNTELRAMVESKWREGDRANTNILPCTVFRGKQLGKIASDDICVYDPGQEEISIEADISPGCGREGSRRSLKISYRVVSNNAATFSEALNYEFDGEEVKELLIGLENHGGLFTDTTYLEALQQRESNNNVRGGVCCGGSVDQREIGDSRARNDSSDDEDKVMISVHLLKSKLRVKKKRQGKRDRVEVIQMRNRNELKSDTVIIVAAGNEEDLHVPRSFSYHDPLNAWYSQTKFITSKPLRMAIKKQWESITNEKSVAQHLAFVCEGEGQKPKVLDTFEEKAKVERELIEIMAHGPKDNALCHILCENMRNCGSDNEDPFPEDGNLPNSFMYAVAKLKHMILPRPNQLGVSSTDGLGALFLLFHDAAHNKFTSPKAEARKKTDHHLNNHQSGSCDIKCPTCKRNGITLLDAMP